MDKDSFSLVEFSALIVAHCPHCGQEHSWRYREAEYVDALPPEQWVEKRDSA
jgi:hypothetical protein